MLKDKTRLDDFPLVENLEDKIAADYCGGICQTQGYYGVNDYYTNETLCLIDADGYGQLYQCEFDSYYGDMWSNIDSGYGVCGLDPSIRPADPATGQVAGSPATGSGQTQVPSVTA